MSGPNFDIQLVVDGRPSAEERAAVAGRLLVLAAPLIGQPYSLAIHQVRGGVFETFGVGELKAQLRRDLPSSVLLNVYARQDAKSGVLTLEHDKVTSGYSIAVRLESMRPIDLPALEERMVSMLDSIGTTAVLIAGVEYSLAFSDSSAQQVVRDTLLAPGIATHVISPAQWITAASPEFVATALRAGRTLLRHRHARERLEDS